MLSHHAANSLTKSVRWRRWKIAREKISVFSSSEPSAAVVLCKWKVNWKTKGSWKGNKRNAFRPLNNSYSISVQLRRAKRDNLCRRDRVGGGVRCGKWKWYNKQLKLLKNSSFGNVKQSTKARTIRASARWRNACLLPLASLSPI